MAVYTYTTLDDLEAHHAIDFSSDAKEWAPEDDKIYHATNHSLVSNASRIINDYCETTFSNHPDCDDTITWVCNELVLRLIQRRNSQLMARGQTSFGDDFMTATAEPAAYNINLTPDEKAMLEPFRDEVVMAVSGD